MITNKKRSIKLSGVRRTGIAAPDPNGNRAQRRAAEREQRKRQRSDEA